MKRVERDYYLQRLINKQNNGLIKVVTGIRRCGKSYLLDPLFVEYLKSTGVPDDHIIKLELDREDNAEYRDAKRLDDYIHSLVKDKQMYYVILDEVQLVDGFESVLNGLLYDRNIDVYVTGSNSRFLSSDIITEFRGRGDQIRVYPFSYSEFSSAYAGDKRYAWRDYIAYGGMPLVMDQKIDSDKSLYLKDLFSQSYIKDIVERDHVQRVDVLDRIIDVLASSVGSLANPQKIYDTFRSSGETGVSLTTIASYLKSLENSFIVSKANRYDVKGRKYISTPQKYYFTDIGLRNARLNFRQQEENHVMENIIYNELLMRGYNVDVGVVEKYEQDAAGNSVRKQLEIDFVCNLSSSRYYIQSALTLGTPEKTAQEVRPLNNTGDSFKKIIVVGSDVRPWHTEDGVLVINIQDFLLDQDSLNL